jgi:hypothetical protein
VEAARGSAHRQQDLREPIPIKPWGVPEAAREWEGDTPIWPRRVRVSRAHVLQVVYGNQWRNRACRSMPPPADQFGLARCDRQLERLIARDANGLRMGSPVRGCAYARSSMTAWPQSPYDSLPELDQLRLFAAPSGPRRA